MVVVSARAAMNWAFQSILDQAFQSIPDQASQSILNRQLFAVKRREWQIFQKLAFLLGIRIPHMKNAVKRLEWQSRALNVEWDHPSLD